MFSYYKAKYAVKQGNKERVIPAHKINSSKKWAEYAVDVHDMTAMLKTATFEEKYALAAAIDAAEKKKNWHFRQANFNFATATMLLQVALRSPRVYEADAPKKKSTVNK